MFINSYIIYTEIYPLDVNQCPHQTTQYGVVCVCVGVCVCVCCGCDVRLYGGWVGVCVCVCGVCVCGVVLFLLIEHAPLPSVILHAIFTY